MAITPSDLVQAPSSKRRRIEKDSIAPTSRLQKLPKVLQDLMGSFLSDSELGNLRKTAGFLRNTSEKDILDRKIKKMLLPHIFGANPSGVDHFFTQEQVGPGVLLKKTDFREGYQSKRLGRFICFRHWDSVSALQAAALCLDTFLIIKLLARLVSVSNDTLRLEAKKQLEEIRSRVRVEDKDQQEDPSSAAKGDSKEAAEKDQDPAKSDRKEATGKSPSHFADQLEYGAPIKALLNAYSNAINRDRQLRSYSLKELLEFEKLWDIVGSCYKRLPRYILQVIFGEKYWWNLDLAFSLEPPRGELRCWNNVALHLDDLGDGTSVGLYKERRWSSDCVRVCLSHWRDMHTDWLDFDSMAVRQLYHVRLSDLDTIIEMLNTLETALMLVADDKAPSPWFKRS